MNSILCNSTKRYVFIHFQWFLEPISRLVLGKSSWFCPFLSCHLLKSCSQAIFLPRQSGIFSLLDAERKRESILLLIGHSWPFLEFSRCFDYMWPSKRGRWWVENNEIENNNSPKKQWCHIGGCCMLWDYSSYLSLLGVREHWNPYPGSGSAVAMGLLRYAPTFWWTQNPRGPCQSVQLGRRHKIWTLPPSPPQA